MMEDPATWGDAEKIVRRVLDDFFRYQKLAATDPLKLMLGWSLEMRITSALRTAGLLKDEVRGEETPVAEVQEAEVRGEAGQGEAGR
jgi:hypothetical protein